MAERVRWKLCAEGNEELSFVNDLIKEATRDRKMTVEQRKERAWELVLGVWADSGEDKIFKVALNKIGKIDRRPKV